MVTRKVGALDVTVVGVGCNNFGGRIDEAATVAVVNAALDAGLNFFDTADIYGNAKSEEFLGRALGPRRKDVVIATKFGYKMEGWPGGAAPDHIRASCEASLRRLGTDVIDLYQLHTPDPNVPIADTLGALGELVQAGKVREIGCSNFDVTLLQDAWTATRGPKFASVQNELSLIHQGDQARVLDWCSEKDTAFLPFFPLACGLLTGKYRMGAPLPEGTRIKEGSAWAEEENLRMVERLTKYAEGKGRTLLQLAFGWLLGHKPVASVIAGATRPEQVRANAAAATWVLSPDELAEVGEVTKATTEPIV